MDWAVPDRESCAWRLFIGRGSETYFEDEAPTVMSGESKVMEGRYRSSGT
jgi:hypothetical protein